MTCSGVKDVGLFEELGKTMVSEEVGMGLSMTPAVVREGEQQPLEADLKAVLADRSLPAHCSVSL